MPSTGIGVYGGSAVLTENDEISSTYEGRHITVNETDITGKEDTYVVKGHPCVVGEHIVGVALNTGTVADELIAIDTEGIWALNVYATDELGNNAVVAGDALYINRTTALISKNENKNTHTLFGYALGNVPAGVTPYVIAVKVHWSPDDAEEVVGATGTPFVNDTASTKFREYYYDAGGGGIIEGERMELNITVPTVTACVDYRKLILAADDTAIITGRSSVFEGRVQILGTAGLCRTCAVAVLDWDNDHTGSVSTSWSNSYIMLRDRHEDDVGGRAISTLLHFYDHDALDDAGVTAGWSVIQDCNAAKTHNVSIACTYGAGNNRFWLMGHTTAPD